MLEGFYGARKVTMGSNRGHLDPQAILWSRSLRGTHDNNVKKQRKEMEAKRRDRLRKNGVLREPLLNLEEEIAPRSASQTPSCSQENPSESPRRPRSKSAEVQGAKKLLRMLHLDHMLPADDDDDVAETEGTSKKKILKGKGKTKRISSQRRPISSKKARPKEASSPVKRGVSPLTSWRLDPRLPEPLLEKLSAKRDHVTMSSQKTVKEPIESDQSSEGGDEPPPVTQWRYKPLPGEAAKETWKSGDRCSANLKSNRKSTETPHFDLDELRIVVVEMEKEHRQCIRSVAESLEHHTRQIVLLTKANSALADHVEKLEEETKMLRAMQFVCTTTQ